MSRTACLVCALLFMAVVSTVSITDAGAAGRDCPSTVSTRNATDELTKALASGQSEAIEKAAERYRCAFVGAQPERPERYTPIPSASPLTAAERQNVRAQILRTMSSRLSAMQSAPSSEAPRVAAEMIVAALAIWRASAEQDPEALETARLAANYLLRAHADTGTGGFGFPLRPNPAGEQASLAARFISRAKQRGMLDQVTRNGWIIDDLGGGGLTFDNGLAGQASVALFEVTKDDRYLKTATEAGAWALSRPMVLNFNYNGFTVALLADLFRITGQTHWLDAAVARAELGLLSGQIRTGAEAGNWADPHNKRIVYRYIMIGQLADLLRAMPANHPRRSVIRAGFDRALENVEAQERLSGGLGNLSSSLVTHCKIAAMVKSHSEGSHRQSDIATWQRDFVATAVRAGQLQFGPVALTCMLELL